MINRCNHNWELVTDTVLDPIPDELKSRITKLSGTRKIKHIVIMKCLKCGKIYKSVEKLDEN